MQWHDATPLMRLNKEVTNGRYYDHIIQTSNDRPKGGDIAQIDFDQRRVASRAV